MCDHVNKRLLEKAKCMIAIQTLDLKGLSIKNIVKQKSDFKTA